MLVLLILAIKYIVGLNNFNQNKITRALIAILINLTKLVFKREKNEGNFRGIGV